MTAALAGDVDDELWSAIGDPTRRRMLDLLLIDGDGTATTLGEQLPISRQAVTKHLAVLDRVTDPRNLGAVCRSAEGAGATGVVVPAHGSAVVTPAVARASAGAIEHLPVAVVTNLARYLGEVKGADLWVFGAAGEGGAPSMWETDLSGGLALVFGAEGKGLRPLVRRTCDALVAIPLAGSVESLNVSVAAAVLLYEARRQRSAI